MKILFIGCVKSSYALLEELLINKKSVCGVVTKDHSDYNSDFCDLRPLCLKYRVPYYCCEDVNEKKSIEFIKSKTPDIIYCFGWSQLLKKEIIGLPKLGVVGFHPAQLPYNKGRHPIIWALVLGLTETASTFFMIDEKIDNGDIVSQYPVKIEMTDDAATLYNKIIETAKKQVIILTEQFESNSVSYLKQPRFIGNTWRKRTKLDGKIDFRMSAENIYNLVRALTRPYAGAHFEYNNCDYKVWKCEIVEDKNRKYKNIEYGKVLDVYSPTSFLVRCGDGLIKIVDCDPVELKIGDYL